MSPSTWRATGPRANNFCTTITERKPTMQRRTFLNTLLAGAGGVAFGGRLAHAALPKMKITRVRYYSPGTQARGAGQNLLSSNVICLDRDAGITGIGEGGSKD